MSKGFKVRFWGPHALFSRPELKVERYSYDVPTPSALIGMIESIYYHPGVKYHIDRIQVLNPIHRIAVKRNEVKKTISADAVSKKLNNHKLPEPINRQKEIVQRSSSILKNVEYIVSFHFELNGEQNPGDTEEKVTAILSRRLDKGQCFKQPYFGCREFPAYFERVEEEGDSFYADKEDIDLGVMFCQMDYSNLKDVQPMFYHPRMNHGVIQVNDYEVMR